MSVDVTVENMLLKRKLAFYEQVLKEKEKDALTNVFSRQKFFDETRKMLDSNPDKQFVFMRIDIDRFQLINSFFGLEEGDKLLQYLAFKLKQFSLVFHNNIIGRIDGDIFAMCYQLNGNVEVLSAMLAQSIDSFTSGYRSDYELSISAGIYIVEQNSMALEEIYSKSILAAKKCKQTAYGPSFAFYDKSLSDAVIKNQRITNEMHIALSEKQFEVVLQPKCDLASGALIGAEALVRWNHPNDGFISPADFIPVFEKNGFIYRLDEYVWTAACSYIRSWLDKGKFVAPISVNVSRYDLRNPALPDKFKGLLKQYDIPIQYLHLEITESAYAEDSAYIVKAVQRLKDAGLHIEMDDFGTAYSSLNMLNEMPIDTLKLDMKFVQGTEKAHGKDILLSFIIKLAHALNFSVIAEGIETAEQAEHLLSLGCTAGQGYYFSKPISKKEFDIFASKKAVKAVS
ncbi:EAL domain-containing protein [Treponema sp. OMZ 840]|uniref:putative bifunctional diguanylate cyclase/phosphodiesterase n=1 Tax=Treponema sp. OMZ 840 TaxID=244313 RepID=UPI003D8BF28D